MKNSVIAFFVSIQIFKYLKMNNVELKPSIWSYSIHGKNVDVIQNVVYIVI